MRSSSLHGRLPSGKGYPISCPLSDFATCSPFLPRLAGLASWESLRRAGRHGGLLLRPTVALARLWFLQKSIRRDFWHLLKKQPLASRAGTHSLLVAPPDGAERE